MGWQSRLRNERWHYYMQHSKYTRDLAFPHLFFLSLLWLIVQTLLKSNIYTFVYVQFQGVYLGQFVEDQALVMHPDQKQTAMYTLLKVLKETVKDNFISAFIYLGGAAMASHCEAIFQVQSMCPTPVAIGSKNTGKTTAANTALGKLGMPAHFHIRDTTDV